MVFTGFERPAARLPAVLPKSQLFSAGAAPIVRLSRY
jgi:hypothetical protein